MAEYGQTLHDAAFRFPLRAAFALLPPRGERLGHESKAASHGDHAWIDKRAEVKGWIEEHFTVIPGAKPGDARLEDARRKT